MLTQPAFPSVGSTVKSPMVAVAENYFPRQRDRDEVTVFGTRFSSLDTREALAAIVARPLNAPFAYVATPNAVHVVNYDAGNPQFVAGINGAWLRLNDSRVVTRLAWMLLGKHLKLAPGSDLTALMTTSGMYANDAVTIIGGTAEMERRLRERFGWNNISRHEPPLGLVEDRAAMQRCIDFVVAHPSRYVFLACGAPQSEMLGLQIAIDGRAVGTGLCIGASLLFVTGLQQRAPVVMQRAGLEWLHRLLCDPRRMSRRLFKGQLPLLSLALRCWNREFTASKILPRRYRNDRL